LITSVRPYFKRILKDLGFVEWRKSLEPDNFPKSLLEDIYHLRTETISGVKQNQRDVEVQVPVTITFAKKSKRDEIANFEVAEETIQDIIGEVLSPQNKEKYADGIVRISFNQAIPEALSVSNDNILLSRVQFTAFVSLDV
jgi:hypothetical protein